MKALFFLSIAVFFLGTSVLQANTTPVRQVIEQAAHTPMPTWQMPEVTRSTLAPGLSLWVLVDHTLPVVELLFQLPYGSFSDPDDRFGRSALMAEAWRNGGTQMHSPDEFAALLGRYAIELGVDVKGEYTLISLKCLKTDLPRALSLFQEWFLYPAFDSTRFDLIRRHREKHLLDIRDYPDAIASYLYPGLVYGQESKWGRALRTRDVARVTREDGIAAYDALLRSGSLLVGAAGDVKLQDLTSFVKVFGREVAGTQAPAPTLPPPLMAKKKWTPGLTFVEKAGDQSTIVLGHLGERRSNPDRFALLLANDMLGGDPLGSLLAVDIRSARGLVYDIASSYGFETEHGLFTIEAKTKAEHTALVLSLIQEKMKELRLGKGLDEGRLALAKRSFLSDLLFNNERKGGLLKTLMRFHFYGYADDYLAYFEKQIQKTTLNDVRKVVETYFFPDRLTVLVVGPKEIETHLGAWKPRHILNAGDSVK